jgi:hypothetical protein
MPNFLNNSIDQFNRGYQQMYGRPVAAPVAQAQVPPALQQPVAPIAQPAAPAAAPAAQALDPYDEAHRLYHQALASDGQPNNEALRSLYLSHLNRHFPGHIEREAVRQSPTPMNRNPEVGQPANNDSADGSSSGGFLDWIRNFFGGGAGQSQQPTTAPLNVPLLDQSTQVGPPTPATPQAPQTTGGVATDSSGIDASNAANTSFGGGGMSGGEMGSSAIGAIGSGLQNIGKNISSEKASYTAPNLPLPKPAFFTPPNLSPNTRVSY